MDLQALLQMFLESQNGDTAVFADKLKAMAAERGFEISDEQLAQGIEVLKNLYGQYQRGEEMDLASLAPLFMGGEDNGLAGLANMFMAEQGGADMLGMLGMMNGAQGQEGGMDLASMAQLMMKDK